LRNGSGSTLITLCKALGVSACGLLAVYFGWIGIYPTTPSDPDLTELVQQARSIAAAWRHLAAEPGRNPYLLKDLAWWDGADDLTPYLGTLPVPPGRVVSASTGVTRWFPVLLEDPAILTTNEGRRPPEGREVSGFVAPLEPSNPSLCRAIAAAAGKAWESPREVSNYRKWGEAAGLAPGEFACIWFDTMKVGKFVPGNPAYFIMRVL
jgi:hypothetical protein